jgi:hypothetical protein
VERLKALMVALAAVGLVVAGPAFLVRGGAAGCGRSDVRLRRACERADTVDCVEDEPARLVDRFASTLGAAATSTSSTSSGRGPGGIG